LAGCDTPEQSRQPVPPNQSDLPGLAAEEIKRRPRNAMISGGYRHRSTRNQGEGLAMAERLRVLIVDDQRLLCEGFRKLNFS